MPLALVGVIFAFFALHFLAYKKIFSDDNNIYLKYLYRTKVLPIDQIEEIYYMSNTGHGTLPLSMATRGFLARVDGRNFPIIEKDLKKLSTIDKEFLTKLVTKNPNIKLTNFIAADFLT